MEFVQHGHFEVRSQGQVIYISIEGSFNEEGVANYIKHVERIVEEQQGKPFAILLDATNLEGGTPECWDAAAQMNLRLADKQLIAKAIVSKGAFVTSLADKVNKPALQTRVKLFTDRKSALSWLQQQAPFTI